MSRFALDLLLAALLLAAFAAYAQGALMLNVGSHHLGEGTYCQSNQGLGAEARLGTVRPLFGFYKNSLCRTSAYFGASYQPVQWRRVRAGLVTMLASGYESPFSLAFGAAFSVDGVGNLIWIPNKEGQFNRGVFGLQLELARW